jgi:hypothetical protein
MNPSKVFDEREKELIDSNSYKVPGGCSLIRVPLRYYDDFINHLETALQDLAGEATLLNECPIQTLDGCVDNALCPLITVNASISSEISIVNQIPNNYFDSRRRWKRYPDIQRYSHVDLAVSGRASLCIVHKELSETNKQFIVVDLILDIIAPDKIDVNRVADFFENLKERYVFSFNTITYDQFNSAFLESRLIKNQIAPNIKHLSVESSAIYGMTASLIAEKRLRVGEPGLLEKQLTSIQIINNKPFIDPNIIGHKDCADALVGSVYNAIINLNDQPSNIYENYNKYLAGIFEIDKTQYRKLDI